jgi:hypothetical protein
MTHAENLGDCDHRQTAAVGGSDRLIAVLAQILGHALELGLAACMLLGELRELVMGIGSFPSGPGDPGIVRVIPANRLA